MCDCQARYLLVRRLVKLLYLVDVLWYATLPGSFVFAGELSYFTTHTHAHAQYARSSET